MDAYPTYGDHYYQGYPAQAPTPGTAGTQALPPGTVPPAEPPAPASAPVGPPGVAPSPSPSPAAPPYYGTYAPPPHGYFPPPAERWGSYPVSAAENHPHASYPPTPPYNRPGYGHHPYQQQDPFRYTHSFPGPPQAYMGLPPRGSDVAGFRKKRNVPPHQNLRPKNKPFKQPFENFRGGARNFEQVNKKLISDPRASHGAFSGVPVANNAPIPHPLWKGRADGFSANRVGQKRRMEERGEGRNWRRDDRRKGDNRARPGWHKGKRKKGGMQGGDKSSVDPNSDGKGISSTVKGLDPVPMTMELADEAAVWLELHRDVRKRVQEFLHALERGNVLKTGESVRQEAAPEAIGSNVHADTLYEKREPTLNEVGKEGNAEIPHTHEERQEAYAEVQMQDTEMKVGGNAVAEMPNTKEETHETGATQVAIELPAHSDAIAHMVEDDVAAPLELVGTQYFHTVDSPQADPMDALHSGCTEQTQLINMGAVQSDSADLPLPGSQVDGVQLRAPDPDEASVTELKVVDKLKSDSENAPQLAAEIVQDLKMEGVQEVPGVNKVKFEHVDENPLVESAHVFLKERTKNPEVSVEEELKDREERTIEFFTKLLEENRVLRSMYIEKQDNGSFECLICQNRKRFSNLVSLVSHASNVLKTKNLPEHRGYGRAVCSLFGWDPRRVPKVPKSQVSHLRVQSAPEVIQRSVVHKDREHILIPDAPEDVHEVVVVKGTPPAMSPGSKLRHEVKEIVLNGEAYGGVHKADGVEGEFVVDTDHAKLGGEGDEIAPVGDALPREADNSSKEELVEDAEDICDKGGISKELGKGPGCCGLVKEEREGNEQLEGSIVEVAKSLETREEVQLEGGIVDVAKSLEAREEVEFEGGVVDVAKSSEAREEVQP